MENNIYEQLDLSIQRMAQKINAPVNLLPTYRVSDDGALPHIVIDESGTYHFIVVERGKEIDHRETNSEDELLYWVFAGITFSMACKYELKHRIPNQDFRKLLFRHQEDLLGNLSESWKQLEMAQHHQVLKQFPFDDTLN